MSQFQPGDALILNEKGLKEAPSWRTPVPIEGTIIFVSDIPPYSSTDTLVEAVESRVLLGGGSREAVWDRMTKENYPKVAVEVDGKRMVLPEEWFEKELGNAT